MSYIPKSGFILPKAERGLADYNYNNSQNPVPYVIQTPQGGGKPILYLGAKAQLGIQGERIKPVNVILLNELNVMHDGDIVFAGNFEGGGEITATGNIYLKGNVSGTVADGYVPITRRLQLSAPNGIVKAEGKKHTLAKANIEAQKAILSDCLDCAIEAEDIAIRRADKHTRNFLNSRQIPFSCEEWIQSWPERVVARKMANSHTR